MLYYFREGSRSLWKIKIQLRGSDKAAKSLEFFCNSWHSLFAQQNLSTQKRLGKGNFAVAQNWTPSNRFHRACVVSSSPFNIRQVGCSRCHRSTNSLQFNLSVVTARNLDTHMHTRHDLCSGSFGLKVTALQTTKSFSFCFYSSFKAYAEEQEDAIPRKLFDEFCCNLEDSLMKPKRKLKKILKSNGIVISDSDTVCFTLLVALLVNIFLGKTVFSEICHWRGRFDPRDASEKKKKTCSFWTPAPDPTAHPNETFRNTKNTQAKHSTNIQRTHTHTQSALFIVPKFNAKEFLGGNSSKR